MTSTVQRPRQTENLKAEPKTVKSEKVTKDFDEATVKLGSPSKTSERSSVITSNTKEDKSQGQKIVFKSTGA